MSAEQPTSGVVQFKDLGFLGYPHYRVGADGSLWRLWGKGWVRAKRGKPRKAKYVNVVLYPGARAYRMHRLVLEAFVGPRPPGMHCRHLNGDGHDNRVENLAWGTPRENERDKERHGTRRTGERHPNAVLKDADVPAIHGAYDSGETIRGIAARYGVRYTTIWNILRGDHYHHAQPSRRPIIRDDRPRGSNKSCAKLAETDIPHIRTALRAGESERSIARRYGISHSQIHTIAHGRSWKHVPDS